MYRRTLLALILFTGAPLSLLQGAEFGVVRTSWTDIRRAPKADGELITQALFGDTLLILKRQGRWALVQVSLQKGLPGAGTRFAPEQSKQQEPDTRDREQPRRSRDKASPSRQDREPDGSSDGGRLQQPEDSRPQDQSHDDNDNDPSDNSKDADNRESPSSSRKDEKDGKLFGDDRIRSDRDSAADHTGTSDRETEKRMPPPPPLERDGVSRHITWEPCTGWVRLDSLAFPADRRLEDYQGSRVVLFNSTEGLYVPVYTLKQGVPRLLKMVPEGCVLAVHGSRDNLTEVLLPSGQIGLVSSAGVRPFNNGSRRSRFVERMIAHCRKFLGKPYVLGGINPVGVDSPGLIYIAARIAGRIIPRESAPQFMHVTSVARSDAQRGDLVFFTTQGRSPSHVGLYLGEGRVLHSFARGVVISDLYSSYLKSRFIGFGRIPLAHASRDTTRPEAKYTPKPVPQGGAWSIHLMSVRKISTAHTLLRQIQDSLSPVFVDVISTRQGVLFAVYAGLFPSRSEAGRSLRSKRWSRVWSKAAVRGVPFMRLQGGRFHTVQLMTHLDIRLGLRRGRRLFRMGYPIWLRYERGRKGRMWLSVLAGFFNSSRKAARYARKIRINTKGRPYVRRFP